MRYQEGKRRKTHAPREAAGAGCPARNSQIARKSLQKRGSKVNGFTLLPPFSSPRAGPAGPEGGPGRPSSLEAAPLKNLPNHWIKLMFRSRRWGSPLGGPRMARHRRGILWPGCKTRRNNKNQEN